MKLIKRTCLNCSKVFFKPKHYFVNKNRGKCCSLKCMFKLKLKQNIKKCLVCKKDFHVKPSLYEKVKFCDRNCYNKYNKGSSHPSYKRGKPKCINCNKSLATYNAKRCHLCENKRRVGKNSPRYGKCSHGKWGEYKHIKMRSSYEMAYAKYLDQNNIKWLYEPKTFDLGNTTYTPDFYLPDLDLYIEIKGYWREDAKKKFKKFIRKYNNENIIVVNKDKLLKLDIVL